MADPITTAHHQHLTQQHQQHQQQQHSHPQQPSHRLSPFNSPFLSSNNQYPSRHQSNSIHSLSPPSQAILSNQPMQNNSCLITPTSTSTTTTTTTTTTAASSTTPIPASTTTNHKHNPSSTTSPAFIQARPSTPARFLSSSSSPLPPPTSAYALISSNRNLGTPTSDLRATSPSSNLNYQSNDSDPLIDLSSSSSQSTDPSHRNWAQVVKDPNLLDEINNHHPQSVSSSSSSSTLPHHPDYLKHSSHRLQSPSVALPGVQNLLESDLNCFWAIVDDNLKLAYIDPSLKQRLGSSSDQIYQYSLYQLIHPADLDQFILDLDLDRLRHSASSTDHRRDSQPPPPNLTQASRHSSISSPKSGGELQVGTLKYSNSPIICCRFARHAQLRRLLGTGNPSYSIESDDQYKPAELLLNPIGQGHLLVFFHFSQARPEPLGNAPYPSWSSTPTSLDACGVKEPDPQANYFSREEARTLERAIAQPPSSTSFQHRPSSSKSRSSSIKQIYSLDVFLILDSNNGRVLFSHHTPSPGAAVIDHKFCPEDYAYLAMQVKQKNTIDISNEERSGHTNCSRQLTGHHHIVKDGSVTNVFQSFVIEYGSVTFAAFKSNLSSPRSQPLLNQPSSAGLMGNIKPSSLDLIQDSRPVPLDLYSPTSSRLDRCHKRPRTDSCSEVLTPQSASSVHSQAFSQPHYQRPSTHPSHQYSSFGTHHHLTHHPPSQSSSITSSIPMPESPDPYGCQYTHFSGELSPTMASAANVLGSFHRAHYHHPQSILALQDVNHHQISPPSSAHSSMMSYENYGLQNLASMAVTASFDPPPPPPDFSSASSSSSSPHSTGTENFGSSIGGRPGGHMASTVRQAYRAPSRGGAMSQESSTDASADGLLGMGLRAINDFGQSTEGLVTGYGSMSGTSPVSLAFHDNRTLSKRPRIGGGSETNPSIGMSIGGGPVDGAIVRCCTSCGAQNSPEWRKGPNGVKSLCNACGLRFSRAQARKSKVPKNMSGSGNLKKPTGVINKKKSPSNTQQSSAGPVLGEEDSRLVVEGFRG